MINQRPIEIEKLMARRGHNPHSVFANIAYNFMSHLHLSYEEIKKMPVPMAIALMNRLKAEDKKIKQQMSKRRRR